MNSPELSHQENNYFYNTKINRLILQEAPNNSIQNIYHNPTHANKSPSIGYHILQGNIDNFQSKEVNEDFFNRNTSYQNLPMDMMKLKSNEDYDNKDINRDSYINFKNNSNNVNYDSINYNDKTDNIKLSNSLKVNNEHNNQDFNKKHNIEQDIKYNYYIKNHKIPGLSPENNNYKTRKDNIKYKFNYPRMLLSQDKEINNEFNPKLYMSKQEFYKKKNNININNKDKISPVKNSSPDLSGYIYLKHNQKNINLNDVKKRNNPIKGFITSKLNRNNKIYDNNILNNKLEKFCEILEEIYFLSFKTDYNYFINNIKLYNKNKNMSKVLILRRYDDLKKHKEKKGNKSMLDIDIENNEKYKDILFYKRNKKNIIKSYDDNNKSLTPSKFKKSENN